MNEKQIEVKVANNCGKPKRRQLNKKKKKKKKTISF